MRPLQIILSNLKISNIIQCRIIKSVNEHGHASIRCYITKEQEEQIFKDVFDNKYFKIEGVDESNNSNVLFTGIVEDFEIEKSGDLRTLQLKLVSSSYLLDLRERIKSFQDVNMSYSEVLEFIKGNYNDLTFNINIGDEENIEKLIVQYKETDWEFIKRLASKLNGSIIPHYKDEGIKVYFGLQNNNNVKEVSAEQFTIRKSLMNYREKKNINNLLEEDEIVYSFETREFYDLGDCIIFNGTKLYVYQVESEMTGQELVNKYKLKSANGFKVPIIKNKKIIGASIDANIVDIKQDKVKVYIRAADIKLDVNSSKWFSYATVYSSSDGTGWYCMPELKDRVSIYFPSDEENDAYVNSSAHLEVEGGDQEARSNPSDKTISNKYGKMIKFTPSSLIISNNKGMTIELNDNEGVSIISNKDIDIVATDSINVISDSDSILVEGKDLVSLKQGNAKLELDKKLVIEGAQMKLQ